MGNKSSNSINALSHGEHGKPYEVLGVHPIDKKTIAVRAFRPTAKELYFVSDTTGPLEMERLNDEGFFEVTVQTSDKTLQYHLRETTHEDQEIHFKDPYSFPLSLTD